MYFQSLRFVRGDNRDKRKKICAQLHSCSFNLALVDGAAARNGHLTDGRSIGRHMAPSTNLAVRAGGGKDLWPHEYIFDHINAYQKCIFFNKEQLRHFACMRCTKCKTGKNALTLSYFRAALSVRKYCFYVIFYLYLTLTSL